MVKVCLEYCIRRIYTKQILCYFTWNLNLTEYSVLFSLNLTVMCRRVFLSSLSARERLFILGFLEQSFVKSVCSGYFYVSGWAKACPDSCKLYFGMCLWKCFWKRSAFESVDTVKKIAFTFIIQFTEDLNRTKRRKNAFPLSSWAGVVILGPQRLPLLVSRSLDLDWDLPHCLLWFSVLWTQTGL